MGDASVIGNKPLCHSAAYMYRIGWAAPINARGDLTGQGAYGNLTAGNFSGGSNEIRGLYLPATSVSDRNMIRVALGAKDTSPAGFGIAYPAYFISYRSKQSGQPSVSTSAVGSAMDACGHAYTWGSRPAWPLLAWGQWLRVLGTFSTPHNRLPPAMRQGKYTDMMNSWGHCWDTQPANNRCRRHSGWLPSVASVPGSKATH